MFVKLLDVLISNILCCFSVLVCCRSSVQIGVQKGEIEQKWKFDPCQCDWAHLVRSSLRGAIERIHVDPYFTRCPSRPYAPSLQHLRRGDSEAVMCDRSHIVGSNAVRSNSDSYHRTHTALRSNATFTIERMQDCDQSQHLRSSASTWPGSTLVLSINRTLMYFVCFTFGRRL